MTSARNYCVLRRRWVQSDMRFPVVLAFSALLVSGCGYVHFGRLPVETRGDSDLQRAYGDLSTEHKVLKQELALARKENDSLHAALDRAGAGSGAAPAEAAHQLEETSKELAALRADYAKLKAERLGSAEAATTSAATDTDALRSENTRLRQELDQAHQHNAELAEQLKTTVARNEQAEASLTALNGELLEQKIAREKAEQVMTSLRTQLEAVMARAGRADGTAAASAVGSGIASTTTAPSIGPDQGALSALQNLKAPPSDAAPIVELRTRRSLVDHEPLAATNVPVTNVPPENPGADTPTPQPTAPTASVPEKPAVAPRTYTVQAGDTLEKIAVKVYGTADQWGKIYDANASAFATSQGLKAGMTLRIP